jgi:hypothetical protein
MKALDEKLITISYIQQHPITNDNILIDFVTCNICLWLHIID